MSKSIIHSYLIKELSADRVGAFDEIYLKYRDVILANISRLVAEKTLAEDILQEVFLKFWENRKSLDPIRDPGSWLFVVSYNLSLAYLRKKVKERIIYVEHLADTADVSIPGNTDVEEFEIGLLNEAIQSLSPRKKMAFELCRLEGKSYSEAARILDVSSETVKDHLKESLKYIRKFILSKNPESALLLLLYLAQ